MTPAPPNTPGKRVWRAARLVLGLALAAAFLVLAFRDIDWDQLAQVARGANPAVLLAALLIGSINLGIRALRWHVLLAPGHPGPFPGTFWVVTVGYLGNNVLPMRAGDLGRSYLMGRRSGMGGSFALATTAAERVFDAIFLVVLGGLALQGHPALPPWLSRGMVLLAVAAIGALFGLLLLPAVWGRVAAWAETQPRMAGLVSRLRQRWLDRFIEGLSSIRHLGRLAVFLILTCCIWSVDALTTVLVGAALGVQIPLLAAFVILAALGVSSAVPLTPGQVGVYQWVASSVAVSYGIAREPALLLAVALQVLNYLLIVVWGVLGVIRLGGRDLVRTMMDLAARSEPSPRPADPASEPSRR
jgi:uncharacterized protein (TIRG00374 family)